MTGPAGGLLAIAGVCCCGTTCCTACLGCGTIRRGATTGAAAAGVAAAVLIPGAAAAGFLATIAAVPGPALAAVAALTTAGRAVAGGGVLFDSASACLRARIALRASPGLDARERSMPRPGLGALEVLADAPPGRRPDERYSRTFTASSASIELECVFVSVTPTAVRASSTSLLLTSISRARSLIRTLLIRPFIASPAV